MISIAASIVSLILMGQTSTAAQADQARLRACLEKVDNDPEAGLEEGEKWVALGGRAAARQCVAMAMIAKGHPAEGAARLEQLANDKDGGDLAQRAFYLTLAGNAWMMANAPDAAVLTLTNALKLKPNDAGLLRDRARAEMILQKPVEAAADIEAALKAAPGDPDALTLRALMRKSQKQYSAALGDIDRALERAPQDSRMLTLRGDIVEAQRRAGEAKPAAVERDAPTRVTPVLPQ
jgi:regulator of sirC expression with transglutaminase-like and TPR domain